MNFLIKVLLSCYLLFSVTESSAQIVTITLSDDVLDVLVIAQSNFGTGEVGVDSRINNNITIWNQKKKAFQVWGDGGTPEWNKKYLDLWPLHFAKALLKKENVKIRFVVDARGGQLLEVWLNSGSRHEILNKKIRSCGIKKYDLVLFAQGESNSKLVASGRQTVSDYIRLLAELRGHLKREGVINKDTPWIVLEQAKGGVGKGGEPTDYLNEQIWDKVPPPFHVIKTGDLSTKKDGVHFTSKSLQTIGQKACDMILLSR